MNDKRKLKKGGDKNGKHIGYDLKTGMSGTGKSTVLTQLSFRGYEVIDSDYGKTDEEWKEIVHYKETIEPLLRKSANFEIDTKI